VFKRHTGRRRDLERHGSLPVDVLNLIRLAKPLQRDKTLQIDDPSVRCRNR
jgi:hypothetical protein